MYYTPFILLLTVVILVEATTQLVVKASIFHKLRNWIQNKSNFFGELVNCGYCFSVWASIFWNLVLLLTGTSVQMFNNQLLNFIIFVIITHRLSNYLHGVSDRFFDTSKDIRYKSD